MFVLLRMTLVVRTWIGGSGLVLVEWLSRILESEVALALAVDFLLHVDVDIREPGVDCCQSVDSFLNRELPEPDIKS